LAVKKRILAQPGFRCVAATNTVDLAGHSLPEFIRSRLRPQIERLIGESLDRYHDRVPPAWREFGLTR
jgi:hypothetical protein